MRYERSEQLLHLALRMQASSDGISLQDIQDICDVGRRTAERMRDALISLFPTIEETRNEQQVKRWRLPRASLSGLLQVSADELGLVLSAATHLRVANRHSHAEMLTLLVHKLQALMQPEMRRRTAVDIEALLEAEGYACRVGARPRLDAEILTILRESIKSCRKIYLRYRARHGGGVSERVVSPYGFIYGSRHYLLAQCDKAQDLRSFSLPNIEAVTLMDEGYAIPEDFSLQQHIASRFGVFNEPPMQVVLRFGQSVADDVEEHLFHPSQKIETEPDGRVIVRFTAGGWREICWHLFTWEGHAEIIEPKSLRTRFNHMLASLAAGEPIPRFSDPLMDNERYEQLVMAL